MKSRSERRRAWLRALMCILGIALAASGAYAEQAADEASVSGAGAAAHAGASIRHIGFFVSDVDAYIVREAIQRVADLRSRVEVSIWGTSSLQRPETLDILRRLDVVILDVMPPQPGQWVLENRRVFREDARFYAVRTSNHNEDYRHAGFLWDETVRAYFGYTTVENLAHLLRFVAARDFRLQLETAAAAPVVPPENALYHPDAPRLFTDLDAYLKWYRESNHFHPDGLWNVSVIFPTFAIDGKRAPLDALIRAYERQGINTVCWFREMKDRDKHLAELLSKEPLASRLGSITGFDFRFSSTLSEGAKAVLEKADVPIINAQYLFFGTEGEWLASPQGMSAPDIPLQFSTPELSGLIEPSVIGVKRNLPAEGGMGDAAVYAAVEPNVERLAAELGDVENFLAKHMGAIEAELVKEGVSPEKARALSRVRLFSAAPGAYGTKVEDLTGASGMWEKDDTVAENGFVRMQSFGYSADTWGEALTPVYRKHLQRVDATIHSLSTNLYGTMDNDDMFQYLGGLSMAVKKASGKAPDVFVSNQRVRGQGRLEPIGETLGREARTRYWNPKWIEGMKREGYAGAREMAHFVEYQWGWQVTTPEAVDAGRWKETFDVYVEDKHHLDVKAFLEKANPWAYQSMTARMLEAVRKGYWNAEEEVRRKLAAEYALNVVQAGVACCDHTCNNPLLNQMVVQIVSIPGVLSPQVAEQFLLAVEKVAGKPLDEQVKERRQMLERMEAVPAPSDAAASGKQGPEGASQEAPKTEAAGADASESVTGYRMETMERSDSRTQLSSSGIQWMAAFFVLVLIGVFLAGSRLAQQRRPFP